MAPSSDDAGRSPSVGTPRSAASPAKGHQACERCWKRKQKCDRQLPSCSTCAGLGIACQPRSVQFDLLTDDSLLSHASTQSYVKTLKRRVQELEQNLQSPQKKRRLDPRHHSDAGTGDHNNNSKINSKKTNHSLLPDSGHASPVRVRTAASEAGTSCTRGSNTSRPGAVTKSGSESGSRSGSGSGSGSVRSTTAATTDGSIRAMMGEIGLLTRSALGEPRDDEPTPAASRPLRLALDRVVLAALALDGHDPSRSTPGAASVGVPANGSGGGSGADHGRSSADLLLMAPPDDPAALLAPGSGSAAHLRCFLDEIAARYPHLAGAAAADQLEEQYEMLAQGGGAHKTMSALGRFSVYLAVATGALLAPDAGRLRSFGQRLHAAAVRLLPAILMQQRGNCANGTGTTINGNGNGNATATTGSEALGSIRAILGLVIYATLSPDGGSAWHLLGMASKRCIVLGLRREPDAQAGLSLAELDERRRLFWSVYLLDRSLGLVMDRPFSIQDEDVLVNMPEEIPREMSPHLLALSHHLVVQARLVSTVRTSARAAPLLDYSNFCFWHDYPPPLDHLPPDVHDAQADYLYLLACRTLIQITANWLDAAAPQPHEKDNAAGSEPTLLSGQNLTQNIEDDTAQHCRGVIERAYARADRELFVGSFIDAYDLFAAGVVYLCLMARRQPQHNRVYGAGGHPRHHQLDPQSILETTDLLNKCSMLITSISERFSALKPLRRVLVALVARLRTPQMANGSLPREPLPAIVPAYLKKMVQKWL